jgi:hypothetical protein
MRNVRLSRGRPLCNSTKLHDEFGQHLEVIFHILIDLVEQFLAGDEIRSLYVPVGLLALGLELYPIGKPLIE